MVEWIVPAGREAVLDRLLRLGGTWSLVDWAARRRWIDARYRDGRGTIAIARLYPPDHRVPVAHRRTERFTLALMQGRADTLLDALAEHLRMHEQTFEWQALQPPAPPEPARAPEITDPRELDCERSAFEWGLKPAVRQLIDPRDAAWAAFMYSRAGAAVCVEPVGCLHRLAIVMAAPTLADARAMLDAEFVSFELDVERKLTGTRELGRRLGYPSCCVEAFVNGMATGSRDSTIDHNVRRFHDAWVARPNPRINSLLFGELLQLISFDPCRFDCPAASAIANALFERLARHAPIAAEALDRQLARPVIVDAADHRAWIELEVVDGQDRIRGVEPIRLDWDDPPHAALDHVVGQRVDECGRLPDLPGSRHRVFRFDRGS